ASGLSGGSPMRTGVQALRLSLAGFVVPYMFVYSDKLLMDRSDVLGTLPSFAVGVVVVLLIAVVLEGYMVRPVPWIWRIVILVGVLMAVFPGLVTDVIGLRLAAVAVLVHVLQRERSPADSHFQ